MSLRRTVLKFTVAASSHVGCPMMSWNAKVMTGGAGDVKSLAKMVLPMMVIETPG